MRRAPWLLLVLALLLPGTAAAADMDFYTWNAFDETVAAFQRVALVLRDPGFTVFVMVFAVAGILIGGLLVGIKGLKGQQVNPVGFLIPALIGVALFRAFIWPTGTLFVYDPVRNDTAAVGDCKRVYDDLLNSRNFTRLRSFENRFGISLWMRLPRRKPQHWYNHRYGWGNI